MKTKIELLYNNGVEKTYISTRNNGNISKEEVMKDIEKVRKNFIEEAFANGKSGCLTFVDIDNFTRVINLSALAQVSFIPIE